MGNGLKRFDIPSPKPAPSPFNGWAVSATIVGSIALIGVFIGFTFAVVGSFYALFAGLDGISKARKTGHGLGLAIAGVVLGGIPMLFLIWYVMRTYS